ncbi:MAG: glucan biosynthesis protein, partial [Hyphomicrobiaceae bacterium]|nr:glucan biosynthesis protein [Hyphomicrobiaceae bacterium]
MAGAAALIPFALKLGFVGEAMAQAAATDTVETLAADHVRKLAERTAAREFIKPKVDVPEPFGNLTLEQYRDIRFRPDQAVWRGDKLDYEVQGLPIGHIYNSPVDLWLVEGQKARLLKADTRLFALGDRLAKSPDAAPYGFSGFRLYGYVNRADAMDDFLQFQGASYFKAVGRGQVYGVQARGLALNTARPGGEEFPLFRSIWIERPNPGSREVVVQALLDSPSTTGAYRFVVQPSGTATVIDVDLTLYPRKALQHVGIAPMTSMYLTGPGSRRITGDYRPAIHDSEGLVILNGQGERIWRPLTNPKKLQASAFLDKNPKGFGLSQRDRSLANYEDIEARFHARPTVWIEPKYGPGNAPGAPGAGWGEGYVELIEIPAEDQIHDNIVAYWKPAKELEAGKEHSFGYRMTWADAVPVAWTAARVRKTRVGTLRNKADTKLFVVDFDGPALKELRELPQAVMQSSAGAPTNVVVQRHGEIDGLRVTFEVN